MKNFLVVIIIIVQERLKKIYRTANIIQKGIYAILKLISKITRHINMKNKLSNYFKTA
jgi:hypothetical protein